MPGTDEEHQKHKEAEIERRLMWLGRGNSVDTFRKLFQQWLGLISNDEDSEVAVYGLAAAVEVLNDLAAVLNLQTSKMRFPWVSFNTSADRRVSIPVNRILYMESSFDPKTKALEVDRSDGWPIVRLWSETPSGINSYFEIRGHEGAEVLRQLGFICEG